MVPMTTFTMNADARAPWGRALVTGGAGFLGSHLCTRLLDSDVEVDCVDNLSTGRAEKVAHLAGRPGFRFLERDIADADSVDALTGPYDLVLHLAGPTAPADGPERPREVLDAGSLGTRNALTVADRDGARFLLASSPEAHGDDSWDGTDPVVPYSAYCEATRFSEALVAAHAGDGSNAGIVRLFTAYGPRMRTDDGRMISTCIEQALSGGPVTVPGDGGRRLSLCYVDDMVDGVLLLAASRSVRPVDIGGDEETTAEQIARRVIDLTGSEAPLTFVDGPDGPLGRGAPDTGFAHELFGWTQRVPWEEGLERTLASFTAPPERTPAVVGRGGEWPA
ncbi:NAD-dependent epimerase/dehydratase family protein [Streptomyces sp. S.PNR 29]|uniref:NAD-dependent epimerase/dehydratase family protein n=1 Tax=Streptomyces sp. S.PNR 29 TaxID=2973805 RepID=UPI0025AFC0E1|nr:NAD-dependent epimerase/dehydratase family protein [Streptomyces sp. S.PNR 29]MDN0199800.1 NAD-dependent epimerase/dehydratase family protein [Streptomyces sp. S.PNR 29]